MTKGYRNHKKAKYPLHTVKALAKGESTFVVPRKLRREIMVQFQFGINEISQAVCSIKTSNFADSDFYAKKLPEEIHVDAYRKVAFSGHKIYIAFYIENDLSEQKLILKSFK